MPVENGSDAPQGEKLPPEIPIGDHRGTEAEKSAVIETSAKPGIASAPVVAVASPPAQPKAPGAPALDAHISGGTPEHTEERVKVWLGETKYFLSQLHHDVGGEAGEIIAYLKAKL
jgi:hypothetical protein